MEAGEIIIYVSYGFIFALIIWTIVIPMYRYDKKAKELIRRYEQLECRLWNEILDDLKAAEA